MSYLSCTFHQQTSEQLPSPDEAVPCPKPYGGHFDLIQAVSKICFQMLTFKVQKAKKQKNLKAENNSNVVQTTAVNEPGQMGF